MEARHQGGGWLGGGKEVILVEHDWSCGELREDLGGAGGQLVHEEDDIGGGGGSVGSEGGDKHNQLSFGNILRHADRNVFFFVGGWGIGWGVG